MRGVFSRSRRIATAWLLVIILLAPSALASPPDNTSLWGEFVLWLLGESGSTAGADQDGFMVWLQSRLGVPNG